MNPPTILHRPSGLALILFSDGSTAVVTEAQARELEATLMLCEFAAECRMGAM